MSEGYKGHRDGSAKGKVHQTFDEKGKDAAIARAKKLGKAESTARTWVSEWTNAKASKKSTKSKASAKNNARKPAGKAKGKKAKSKRERLAG